MPRRKRPSRLLRKLRHAGLLLLILVATCLATLGYLGAEIYQDLEASLPALNWAGRRAPAETTRIFARDGRLIATLCRENRSYRELEAISPTMIAALVAIEDSRFFEHDGVDLRAIARAAWANLQSGSIQEGGSTITMQLARVVYLTDEQSYWRKIQEVMLARKIEAEVSKAGILERYLNQVYFGAGAHGIGAAASRYFGVEAKELSAAQSALLAGLLQAPADLSPFTDRKAARHRQVVVLSRMRDLGYLDQASFRKAIQEARTMKFAPDTDNEPLLKYPYFTSFAIHELAQSVNPQLLYEGGLRVYTTVDITMQRAAEEELISVLDAYGLSYHTDSAALVLIENKTGAIRAMVGGRRWSTKDQYNRAWQARRQPGSAFKAFVFSAALERGYTANTMVSDDPLTVVLPDGVKWVPVNSDGLYTGRLRLSDALRKSRNVVAARLVVRTGPRAVVDIAHRLGIESSLSEVPAIALGVAEVSPLEMAAAFSTFANGGTYLRPRTVKLITDQHGQPLYRNSVPRKRFAVAKEVAGPMTEMLIRVVENGTGQAARIPGVQVGGKTGTTDSFKDAWFIGFTADYTMAVWVGNSDNTPTWGVYGGTLPANIWRRVMIRVIADKPVGRFELLASKARLAICEQSRMLAGKQCSFIYRATYWGHDRDRPDKKCDLCQSGDLVELLARGDYPKARARVPVLIESPPALDD